MFEYIVSLCSLKGNDAGKLKMKFYSVMLGSIGCFGRPNCVILGFCTANLLFSLVFFF